MATGEPKICKTIHWSINEFTRVFAKSTPVGTRMKSTTFVLMIDNIRTEWFFRLYPNGKMVENKGYVGFFLILESTDSENITANFKLCVSTPNGMKENVKLSGEEKGRKLKMSRGFGRPKFISHESLFDQHADWMPNKQLTFTCEISLYGPELETIEINPPSVKDNSWISDYKKFFDLEIFSDIELRMSDGVRLKAHKTILIVRSPVFFTMLTGDMKEAKQNFVDIPDVDSATMKELLRFLYTNEVENLDDIALNLIYAAEKYQVDQLKYMCRDRLTLALNRDNVLDVLIVAYRVSDMQELFTKCFDLLVKHYEELSTSHEWKTLPSDLLLKLFDAFVIFNKNRQEDIFVHVDVK